MFGQDRNPGDAYDPFSEIDNVSTMGQRNPYLLAGQYSLKIARVHSFISRQKQQFFLVEIDILWSDNPERPAGMRCSWMTNMNKEMGPINAKRFLAAAMGFDVESKEANTQINGEVARFAVSAEQPLAGVELSAQCAMTLTKEKKDFLDVKWMPAGQQPAG